MSLIYDSILRPLLFRMDPEHAHDRARLAMKWLNNSPILCRLLMRCTQLRGTEPVELFGLKFPNRIGLAAGMDKDGEMARAMAAMGFGFTEVGTVTPQMQPGNPQPRLFRYPEKEAIINRMGFNNLGADAMLKSLSKTYPKGKRRVPVGVNIGKAKTTPLEEASADYVACFRALADQADYFTVNISSPNTQGLRQLQSRQFLRQLLSDIQAANRAHAKKLGHAPHPLLLKIAPDLSFAEMDTVLEVLLELDYSGLIATNTTTARPEGFPKDQAGGLSGGRYLRQRSNAVINYVSKATSGRLPIIGVGGIDSPEAVGEKIDAGASLVQIYTGWIYKGPFFPCTLARALRAQDTAWI